MVEGTPLAYDVVLGCGRGLRDSLEGINEVGGCWLANKDSEDLGLLE